MSDYLAPDFLFLILKPLPVIDILRCRAVCKSWKTAVDSKSFIVDHHLTAQTPRLIAQSEDLNYIIVDPNSLSPAFDQLSGPDQFQSEEDDLCIASTAHGVIYLFKDKNLIFLWNPSIRRQSSLPLPEIYQNPNSSNTCGFWINPLNYEFKVVIFLFTERKIATFSSANQQWNEISMESEIDLSHRMGSTDPQILIGRVGYWKWHVVSEQVIILWFDFVEEKFGTIELPKLEQVQENEYWYRVVKWRDCISIVHWQFYYPRECNLWAFQDGFWSMRFSFSLNEPVYAVLYVGDDCDWVLTEPRDGNLLLFHPDPDPDPEEWNDSIESEFETSGYVSCVYDFVETLVFPECDALVA